MFKEKVAGLHFSVPFCQCLRLIKGKKCKEEIEETGDIRETDCDN